MGFPVNVSNAGIFMKMKNSFDYKTKSVTLKQVECAFFNCVAHKSAKVSPFTSVRKLMRVCGHASSKAIYADMSAIFQRWLICGPADADLFEFHTQNPACSVMVFVSRFLPTSHMIEAGRKRLVQFEEIYRENIHVLFFIVFLTRRLSQEIFSNRKFYWVIISQNCLSQPLHLKICCCVV